jgi:hypothetical protein
MSVSWADNCLENFVVRDYQAQLRSESRGSIYPHFYDYSIP